MTEYEGPASLVRLALGGARFSEEACYVLAEFGGEKDTDKVDRDLELLESNGLITRTDDGGLKASTGLLDICAMGNEGNKTETIKGVNQWLTLQEDH